VVVEYLKVVSWYLLVRVTKTMKTLSQDSNNPSKIRNTYLLSTSLECYQFFGKYWMHVDFTVKEVP
jgi:hypothetical protein